MSWGTGQRGSSSWGKAATTSVVAATIVAAKQLTNVEVLLTFSAPVSSSWELASSYLVTGVTAVKALAYDPVNMTVLLNVSRLTEGTTYSITTPGVLDSSGNPITGSASFLAKKTKVEKVLTDSPALYNVSPSSLLNHILTAIHLENDKIGG